MARRRKESTVDVLFKAPWWVSIAIGAIVYVAMKWLAPLLFGSSQILRQVALLFSSFAGLVSSVFVVIGILAFLTQTFSKKKGAPSDKWTPRSVESGNTGWTPPAFDPSAPDPVYAAWRERLEPTLHKKPTEWSIELLRDLEWKRFEDVCQKFYAAKGIRCETTPLGPDGGIDIRLFEEDPVKPAAIAQCKAWGEKNVGVKPVRELLGVMAHEKIPKAYFMAAGGFTDDAKAFASENRITLVTGDMLVGMIKRLPDESRKALLEFATEGDYRTPTCPSCGIKMKYVTGTGGRQDFWGCFNYPRCRQILGMRARH